MSTTPTHMFAQPDDRVTPGFVAATRPGTAAERAVAELTRIEGEVREFGRRFPTPNVQRMIALCESGEVAWSQAYGLAVKALLDSEAVLAPAMTPGCSDCARLGRGCGR
jgi:hypothetical protein